MKLVNISKKTFLLISLGGGKNEQRHTKVLENFTGTVLKITVHKLEASTK